MNKAIAVIGSGYGDCGKGKMTDYFCYHNPNAINVRFNGGAQAGHTVVTPTDQRWVFSHFGAGSFARNTTFLSKHFVVNPMLFRTEHDDFVKAFGFKPHIIVDPSAIVTTPYEMLVNQILETNRQKSGSNHGSVGIGFGETIEREEKYGINFDVSTLECEIRDVDRFVFDNKLHAIRQTFVPERLGNEQSNLLDMFDSKELIEDYVKDCQYFLDNVQFEDSSFLKGKDLVFEGAQGLLLDQHYGYFPYVTRSNCGLKNVMDIMGWFSDTYKFEVVYVTRAYTTRHGVGPLEAEDPSLSRQLINKEQETNVTNKYQQNFRYGYFASAFLDMSTTKDFKLHAPRVAKMSKAMTCLDQIPDDTSMMRTLKEYMTAVAYKEFDYISTGLTRNDTYRIGT